MARIVVSEFVTLDSVMEKPEDWVFQFSTPEIDRFKLDEVLAGGALLLGYATYQIFAASWPLRNDPAGFADKMNSMPKYVVSTTAGVLAWNNSQVIQGDVVNRISRLKQQPGRDLLVAGSGVLVRTLMQQDLVDEYRLLVYPLVRGKGQRLFEGGAAARLRLTEAKSFPTGVALLRYEPARSSQ